MKQKIVMVTAYDFPTAKIIEEVGVDYILVGDSLGMVVLGYKDTKAVTMNDMIHHTKAVVRGAGHTVIVVDMPFGSYTNPELALKNAQRLITAGAHVVKIEGYHADVLKILKKNGISVMGHVGLLPQIAERFEVQGRDKDEASEIYNQAKALDTLGVVAVVLECIPDSLAQKITHEISVPTIGIGAGVECDGQVLVLHDIIGLSDKKLKMAKQYASVKLTIKNAIEQYKQEVIDKLFPSEENTFHEL